VAIDEARTFGMDAFIRTTTRGTIPSRTATSSRPKPLGLPRCKHRCLDGRHRSLTNQRPYVEEWPHLAATASRRAGDGCPRHSGVHSPEEAGGTWPNSYY